MEPENDSLNEHVLQPLSASDPTLEPGAVIRDQTPRHTPGPWILDSIFPDLDGYKVRGGTLAFRKGPRLIAVVKNQGDSPIAEDHLTDAKLIAAAPEMYEALKAYEALENKRMNCEECEEQLERAPEACGECFPFADDARCKIRAVIAKVEGK